MSTIKITGALTLIVVIIALAVNIIPSFYFDSSGPVIEIDSGKIQGKLFTSRSGRSYFGFLGIPYAENVRFKAPKSPKPWKNKVLRANAYGSPCVQFHMVERRILGTESCLSINVFSPNVTNQKNTPFHLKLPVLVFVHGGYYEFGSSNLFNPKFIMDEDIVFVSFNYRLGALGFLSLGDSVISGNFGLKDQAFALKWIQRNIDKFGGDRNKVTIMGNSAGGASVNLHMLSKSKGLFRRVISGSGTAISPWTIFERPLIQAQRFAKKLNCPITSSEEIRECLMEKNAEEFAEINQEILDPNRNPIVAFVPVVESKSVPDAFINESPENIIKSKQFERVPWMSGVVRDEGKYFGIEIVRNSTFRKLLSNEWKKWSPDILYFKGQAKTKFAETIKQHYFPENNKQEVDFQSYSDILSDIGFFHPVENTGLLISDFVPTFLYYFNYTSDFSLVTILSRSPGIFPFQIESAIGYLENLFYRLVLNSHPPYHSTIHSDDLLMLFPLIPWPPPILENLDLEMSKDMVKLVTDFASKEDLTQLEFRGVQWKSYMKNVSDNYLLIDENPAMMHPEFLKRIGFLDKINNLT